MRLQKPIIPTENISNQPIDGYISATDITSNPIFLAHVYGYSPSVSWPDDGSPVGTFKLQGCNDIELHAVGQPDANLVDWFDIASSSQASSLGSPLAWNVNGAMYRWIRLVYTASSGSITLKARIQIKSMQ